MKKFGLILLALVCLFGLCACGDKTQASVTPLPETEESTETQTEQTHPVEMESGDFDSFSAIFTGAELFTDADGEQALRVYFDFRNKSGESRSPSELLLYSAEQDGSSLVWAADAEGEEPDAAGNLSLRLLPGRAARCVLQFKLLSDSEVTVTLDDSEGHAVHAWLIPDDSLPGRPASELEWDEEADETLSTELPSSCTLYDMYELTIAGGEVSETENGERTINVQVDFTNNSPDPAVPSVNFRLRAYQDGTELLYAPDGASQEPVEAGAGVTVSCFSPFVLHGDGPVLVELYDLWSDSPSAALVIPAA